MNLHVVWFKDWHAAIEEALKSLPESDNCPHELLKKLMEVPGTTPKRTALVTENGVPKAVAVLRQRGHHWEPVTTWIVPGIVAPSLQGDLIPALEALGFNINVAWWRMSTSLPRSRLMRSSECTPTYRIDFSNDFEDYWRQNGYFKTIRGKRNRCQKLTLKINAPGAAEWTIRNWEIKWREQPTIINPELFDRIAAAQYLENLGFHFTISLFDKDKIVGGATLTKHQNDLVAGVIYREPEYEWHGVGVRLIDLSISFAHENGFDGIDLGGGHEYKRHWAPMAGQHWLFNICPGYIYQGRRILNWGRKLDKNTRIWIHNLRRVD